MNTYHQIIAALSDTLDEYHIPHTVHDCWEGAQIRFPWHDGDVAIHGSTYGHENGYVETYLFPWDEGDVSMLTPEEACKNIVALYIEELIGTVKKFIPQED